MYRKDVTTCQGIAQECVFRIRPRFKDLTPVLIWILKNVA